MLAVGAEEDPPPGAGLLARIGLGHPHRLAIGLLGIVSSR